MWSGRKNTVLLGASISPAASPVILPAALAVAVRKLPPDGQVMTAVPAS